ncbi:MAG: PD40 domain-containing protein, partial [Bdellovibrionaceae bacterium]|nr:PD40 domain-containing protein [Pseudobdellovibrionaceae bacterium]
MLKATIILAVFLATGSMAAAHGVPAGADAKPSVEQQQAQPFLTNMTQMTFTGPRAGEGYFNRDGSLMVFQSERETGNPFYQIYVLDRKTGRSVRLSPGQGKTTCAWVHPSDKKALFSSSHLDPQLAEKVKKEFDERKNPVKGKYSWSFDDEFDIFEAPIAAALKTGRAVQAKELRRLTKEKGYDAEASYSPDGKWIAFASNRSGYTETLTEEEKKIFAQDPSYMMDLYLMNSDGTDVRRLTNERGYDGGPFFSPDGKKITWRRFSKNGQYAEIMVMDLKADGTAGKEKQLTSWKAMSWAPFFHPSGDYLIFTSNKLGYTNFELFVVDVEGKNEPTRVSFLDGFDGLPVFLPSGEQMAWTRRDEKGEAQIYIADWDDGLIRSKLGLSRLAPNLAEGQQALKPELSERDLKAWVSYLASEGFKGRRSGTPEERVYTEAIGKYFASLGLKPVHKGGFVQPFEFASGVKLGPLNRMRLREAGAAKDIAVEKEWMPISLSRSGEIGEAPAVFAGFGIVAQATDKLPAFDSYEGGRVDGKWVVAIQDLPQDVSNEVRFQLNLFSRPQHKALIAKQKGAVGLIL